MSIGGQKQATHSEVCSATESLNLMKNLLSTGLSCITYLRYASRAVAVTLNSA